MFEPQLARIRARMERIGRQSGRCHLNPCATEPQLADFEKTLGMALPDELREFLLQVTSGAAVGDKEELQFGPLLPENNDAFRFRYGGGGWHLVPFPLQFEIYDNYQYNLKSWHELSAHEQMESEVGLCFAVWGPFRLAVMVLSGTERGRVWHGSNWSDQSEPSGLSFLDAFETMLDVTK